MTKNKIKKFDIIYCDCPWQFSNKKTGGSMKSGAEAQYSVMTLQDLKDMPIQNLSAENCTLIFWWVGAMPKEAIEVVEAWDFTIKNQNGFVWNKLTVKGNPHFGMGFRTRSGSESAIIATRGKPKVYSHSVRAVQTLPIEKHSKKPDKFRDLIVELCGDLPRLELFARNRTKGWSVFGNQVACSIDLLTGKKNATSIKK